jgi:peroxiredoxin
VLTIHFVDQYKFNAVLLGVYELDERHMSEYIYIAIKLVDVCVEWNITKQKIVAVVTDGAANMTKAIDLSFGKKNTFFALHIH